MKTAQRTAVCLTGMLVAITAVGARAGDRPRKGEKKEATLSMEPSTKGFLEVNGTRLYHEVYGQGAPLVLLHGGLMTIPEMASLIEPLAKTRKVIALELQGHGRTPDTDRPLVLSTVGDDVGAVIAKLGLEQADVVGYSFGADVALRAAIQHPKKVRRLVVISTPFAKRGWYPKAREGMASVGAGLAAALKDTPTAKLAQHWPEPHRFPQFLDKMGKMMSEDYDWSAEVKKLPMPVMLIFADHDSVSQQHVADFFALLGGGTSEPGWVNTKLTRARLAIIPGYSHYNFMSSTELAPLIDKYLRDPLSGSATGSAAASQSAP
jgi:pimeloyl-ACP methyl ester carboxylesterase